jgi:rubrerythrin
MREFVDAFGSQASKKMVDTVLMIADQEDQHAFWIGELLESRNIKPELIQNKKERYWEKTLPGIDSWETGCAVAAHAEKMRLERITAICDDNESPEDVKEVFKKILKDELFHEKAFREFSSEQAMLDTMENHINGKNALGLYA